MIINEKAPTYRGMKLIFYGSRGVGSGASRNPNFTLGVRNRRLNNNNPNTTISHPGPILGVIFVGSNLQPTQDGDVFLAVREESNGEGVDCCWHNETHERTTRPEGRNQRCHGADLYKVSVSDNRIAKIEFIKNWPWYYLLWRKILQQNNSAHFSFHVNINKWFLSQRRETILTKWTCECLLLSYTSSNIRAIWHIWGCSHPSVSVQQLQPANVFWRGGSKSGPF